MLAALPATAPAQNNLKTGLADMIVVPHALTFASSERNTNFEVKANVEYALRRPDLAGPFRQFLKEVVRG